MYFDEIKLHMTQVTAPIIIPKEQILSFGNLYDPLPLHTDEAYAKRGTKNGIVEVTVFVHNQKGIHVLTDVTEVIVNCRPDGE